MKHFIILLLSLLTLTAAAQRQRRPIRVRTVPRDSIILSDPCIFPDTAYTFYGFAGFDGRTVQPVIIQPRVADAHPATQVMIDTYMAALGFEKTATEGRYSNNTYEVWDLVPRNVLVDDEGDVYVVDAEIKRM